VTPERYSQVKSLFQLVLEQPAEQRPAFLERACGADRDLYAQVRELLKADYTSQDFLEKPAITPISKVLDEVAAESEERMPATIGPYALQRAIGSGGMGAVYLGHRADRSFNKQVAIKIIRKGMETDRILQRFRRERQIVASLDHPNIARLLDGGATADGRPYFVMEYVDGMPIDVWCDQRRLPVEARLKLFLQVCDAIHYAHQNLIIHRDIKPGNILVRADGSVKLLDFGIAKLMNPDLAVAASEKTATSMRLMTPQYASPEQVKGESVTTASDVYLLGIVLYELLTGHRPYDVRDGGTMELMRAVSQGEPPKPSEAAFRVKESLEMDGSRKVTRNINTVAFARNIDASKLATRLQGDLDAIALRALRRAPQERYESAAQMAEDVRNHLARLPVTARSQSAGYRFRLFLRRNTGMAAAATAAMAALILVAVFAVYQASRARIERQRAEARFSEVRKMSNTLLFDVQESLAPLAGTTPARRLLVQKSLEYLGNLTKESGDDETLQRELAAGYLRIGHLQGNPNFANLGDTAGALRSYRQAEAMQERLLAAGGKNAALRNELAGTLESLADMQMIAGDSVAALEALRKAVRFREEGSAPADVLAASRHNLAVAMSLTGAGAEARTLAEQAHRATLELSGAGAPRQQALSHGKLAAVLDRAGDPAAAIRHFQSALEAHERMAAADPLSARAKRDLSFALEDLGDATRRAGGDASALYGRVLRLRRELAVTDPQNVQARRDLAYALLKQGAAEDALESFRQLAALDAGNVLARRDLALAHEKLGSALLRASKPAEAIGQFRSMLAAAREWAQKDPASPLASHMIAVAQMKLADALTGSGDRATAVDSARAAITVLDTLLGKESSNRLFRRDRAVAQWVLGRSLGDCAAARPEFIKAKALFEELAKQGRLFGEDAAAASNIDVQLEGCK